MPESPRTSLLAILIASVALALSVYLLIENVRDDDLPAVPLGVSAPAPEAGSRAVATPPEPRTAPEPRSADVAADRDYERREVLEIAIRELTERVAQLEAQIAQVQRAAALDPRPRVEEPPPRSPEEIALERVARIQRARGVILDGRATEQQKLEAWRELRGAGKDAWDDATVAEMTFIGLTSTDPDVRADVWRQASAAARSDALVPALIQALVQDAHRQAREEAAETLANYRDLPQVRQALEAAAANDQEESVRRQASNSLRGGR